MQKQDEFMQFQGHLFHVANQIEQMQWELARLVKESRSGNSKMTALAAHLIHSEHQQRSNEVLAEFRTQLEANQEKLDEFAGTIKKMNRTQFKANALGESKERQTDEAIVLLRELIAKHEDAQKSISREEQEGLRNAQADARSELAADFLPVLDGIEMALAHNIAPVDLHEEDEEEAQQEEKPEEPAPGLFKKLFASSSQSKEKVQVLHEEKSHRLQEIYDIHDTVRGWRQGLDIVRERFLRLIEAEGIEAIPALGELFNPHRHVAVEIETRSDVPENTIVNVLRKGYKHNDRVLRYSEVIVAKAPKDEREDA